MNKKLIALGLGAAVSASAFAYGPAVVSITGGSPFGSYYGSVAGDVIGYGFTTGNDSMQVDALGVWIDSDGLQSNHMVGIWDLATGGLVVSADVDISSGFDQAGWHYNSVSSAILNANASYVAGALYFATDGDSYISSNTGLTMDPNLTHDSARFPDSSELGFVMPGSISAGNLGRHGPNFITSPVPEPATLAVLGLGAAALLRRRKKA